MRKNDEREKMEEMRERGSHMGGMGERERQWVRGSWGKVGREKKDMREKKNKEKK